MILNLRSLAGFIRSNNNFRRHGIEKYIFSPAFVGFLCGEWRGKCRWLWKLLLYLLNNFMFRPRYDEKHLRRKFVIYRSRGIAFPWYISLPFPHKWKDVKACSLDGERQSVRREQGKVLWCNTINLKFINNRRKVDILGVIFIHLCASFVSKMPLSCAKDAPRISKEFTAKCSRNKSCTLGRNKPEAQQNVAAAPS